MAYRGYGGRFAGTRARSGGPAATPGIAGVAGGPVVGWSGQGGDAGAGVRGEAPYVGAGPAPDTVCCPEVAHPELYGAAGPAFDAGAGELPSWIGRDPSPIGLGDGSYALDDAADRGAPVDTPEHGLPGLVSGVYDYSARLHNLGDQAFADRMVQAGGSYVGYDPAPWFEG